MTSATIRKGPDEKPDMKVQVAQKARSIVLDEEARDAIDVHVSIDTRTESGGVLVGSVDESSGDITVLAAIPANRAIGTATSLTFTHDAWDDVNEEIGKKHPGSRMVGWFHSHPHFGIFLSEYDTFIHKNFFSEPWQIAYVVDPLLGQAGFFGWEDDTIVRHRTWTTIAHGSARVAPTTQRKDESSGRERLGASRSKLFVLLIPLLICAILLGYFLHRMPQHEMSFQPLHLGNGITDQEILSVDSDQTTLHITITNTNRHSSVAGYIENCAPPQFVGEIDVTTGAATGGKSCPFKLNPRGHVTYPFTVATGDVERIDVQNGVPKLSTVVIEPSPLRHPTVHNPRGGAVRQEAMRGS